MQHAVDAAPDGEPERHVLLDELEERVVRQMREIRRVARQEAVDADDLVPVGQEAIGEV